MDEDQSKYETQRGTVNLMRSVAFGGPVLFLGLLAWLVFLGPLSYTLEWLEGKGLPPAQTALVKLK